MKENPMTKTVTAKPAAPKAAVKAPAPTPTPEVKPAEVKVNPAYAPADVRAKIAKAFEDLDAKGFTRPMLADLLDTTKGAVWRFQTSKIHTTEVDAIMAFIADVVSGKVAAPERKSAKVSAVVLQERVANATKVLEAQADAKSVTALRALVADALAALQPSA